MGTWVLVRPFIIENVAYLIYGLHGSRIRIHTYPERRAGVIYVGLCVYYVPLPSENHSKLPLYGCEQKDAVISRIVVAARQTVAGSPRMVIRFSSRVIEHRQPVPSAAGLYTEVEYSRHGFGQRDGEKSRMKVQRFFALEVFHGAVRLAESKAKSIGAGKLIICECVVAEIYPALNNQPHLEEFFADWQLEYSAIGIDSALLAGEYFATYLSLGGQATRVVPDFFIGAHALKAADRLLARDRGYLKEYFRTLEVWDPSQA